MGQLVQVFDDDVTVEAGIVRYHVEWTSGNTGAVPTFPFTSGRAQGLSGVTRTGAGVFDLLLNNPAIDFVDFVAFIEQASPSNTGACHVTVVDAVSNTTTPKITITCRKNSDYSVQDPTSGDVIYVSFSVITKKVR